MKGSDEETGAVQVPVSQWRKKKYAPTEPLGVAKGSGFFKDKFELDLRARSDASKPFVPHPLSYDELSKYGCAHLSDTIVANGGPYAVGVMAEIDWKEPDIVLEAEPESLRPRREETFALNMRGELAIGGGLEEKLAAAESLDLAKIKAEVDSREKNARIEDDKRMMQLEQGVVGVDYKKRATSSALNAATTKLQVEKEREKGRNGERFSLDSFQRLFLVVTMFSFVVAHGRASADIVNNSEDFSLVVEVANYLSLATLTASMMSGAACGFYAFKSGKKNPSIHGLMGILGGPSTIQKVSVIHQ